MKQITNREIHLFASFLKHVGKVFEYIPTMPNNTPLRVSEAYRLAKFHEFVKCSKVIERLKNENKTDK